MARADTIAQRLLDDFGVTRLPIDPVKMAEDLGTPVVYRVMTPDVSGMLIREPSGSVIGVNDQHAAVRQRFTVAHELGHLHLHPGRPLIVDAAVLVNLRDQVSSLATDREEIEANRFAAALLMPDVMVRAELDRLGVIDPDKITNRLAKIFNVSAAAMTIRLTTLGLFGLA
jgi:Zn-dependent peptidase ImmA (M78 family)